MSRQGYWVKRDEKKFEASSWETLCQWASQGRLKLSDEFITPENAQWRLVEREPTLSALIPQRERLVLKRGDHTYRAPNYELIQQWASRGQVSPEDLIYSSYTQLWTSVNDLANIMKYIPEEVIKKTADRQTRRRGVAEYQGSSFREIDSQSDFQGGDESVQAKTLLATSRLKQEQQPLYEPSESASANMSNDGEVEAHDHEQYIDGESDTEAMIPALQPSPAMIKELCAPIYDAARLFIVIKDLRPLDRLKGECLLKSLELDCQGMSKKEALSITLDKMQKHQREYLANEVSASSIGAVAVFKNLIEFISLLEQGLDIVGSLDDERFVVGNQNRPKMTADEATLMINLHSAVEQMIHAVRLFKQ